MSSFFPVINNTQSQTGNIEVALPYGGDMTQQANGDLVLAIDTPGNPTATIQRVQRLLYTNPRQQDLSGNYTTSGDDIFHPDWGAGIPSRVGSMFPGGTSARPQNNSVLNAISAQVRKGLSLEPTIAQTPLPVVSVNPDVITNQVDINIICTAITGQIITVPARPITGGS